MSNQTGAELETLLAHLLANSAGSQPLEKAAISLEMEDALTSLESLFSWEDDPAWLEAIAAARGGLLVPEIEGFLENNKAALSNMAPKLVTQFEILSEMPITEDEAFLPAFPTFAEEQSATWIKEAGFKWKRLQESGRLLIQLLQASFRPSPLSEQAVRGTNTDLEKTKAIHQLSIQADDPDDLDVEGVIWPHPDVPQQGILRIRAQIPSRWPNMEGILVKATAENWEVEGTTNDDGDVFLEGLPLEAVDTLKIEITP